MYLYRYYYNYHILLFCYFIYILLFYLYLFLFLFYIYLFYFYYLSLYGIYIIIITIFIHSFIHSFIITDLPWNCFRSGTVMVRPVARNRDVHIRSSPNPCQAFFCAVHHYQGPYGRHIAIAIHFGQGFFIAGAVFVAIGFSLLRFLNYIVVLQTIGLYFIQNGLSLMIGGFATYIRARHTKVGGVSQLWSRGILVTLYTRVGFLEMLLGSGLSLVGFQINDVRLQAFKIAGLLGLFTGIATVITAGIYLKRPCCKTGAQNTTPTTAVPINRHCACPHAHSQQCHNVHNRGMHLTASNRMNVMPPVVVCSTPGTRPIIPNFNGQRGASPVLPPRYENLSPPVDPPPGYVLVSPVSPPPSYTEACPDKADDNSPADIRLNTVIYGPISTDHTPAGYPA